MIADVINDNTQPSPSDTLTKHDFSPGLHRRSPVDRSLECLHPERCPTEGVRFLVGSETELHRTVCKSLQDAVSSSIHHNEKNEYAGTHTQNIV